MKHGWMMDDWKEVPWVVNCQHVTPTLEIHPPEGRQHLTGHSLVHWFKLGQDCIIIEWDIKRGWNRSGNFLADALFSGTATAGWIGMGGVLRVINCPHIPHVLQICTTVSWQHIRSDLPFYASWQWVYFSVFVHLPACMPVKGLGFSLFWKTSCVYNS